MRHHRRLSVLVAILIGACAFGIGCGSIQSVNDASAAGAGGSGSGGKGMGGSVAAGTGGTGTGGAAVTGTGGAGGRDGGAGGSDRRWYSTCGRRLCNAPPPDG